MPVSYFASVLKLLLKVAHALVIFNSEKGVGKKHENE